MDSRPANKPDESKDFLTLFTSSNRIIFHFILTMIPNWNDAQDVMQETSRILWEKFEQFEAGTDFVAWALTIARYQALNFRKKRPRPLTIGDELLELFTDNHAYPHDQASDRISALRHCMARLNESDRKHLRLRFQEEYSPKLLAQRLQVSVKRIYRSESRIMGLLLRCIRRRLFEEGLLG